MKLDREKSNIRQDISKPKVTIVSVVFNDSLGIQRTIQSLKNQVYPNMEYVVIDGCSTDGTVEIIKKCENAIDYWVSEPDKGISDAFNKGIEASTGEWLYFLNAGDSLINERVLNDFAKELDPAYDVVYGHIVLKNSSGGDIGVFGKQYSEKKLWKSMIIPHQAAFHNRRYFEEYGYYSLSYRHAMDYEILLRKKGLKAKYINKVLAEMIEGGVSRKNVTKVYKEYFNAKVQNKIKNRFSASIDFCESHLKYWLTYIKYYLKS